MKKNIMFFILGIAISGILVPAAANLKSEEVSYSNSKTTATNVKGAINDLYVKIKRPKYAIGTVAQTSSTTTKVTLGFRPKYISITDYKSSTAFSLNTYNEDLSTTYQVGAYRNGSTTNKGGRWAIPYTSESGSIIYTIDSDGFIITKYNSAYGTTLYYFAIGE